MIRQYNRKKEKKNENPLAFGIYTEKKMCHASGKRRRQREENV